MLSYTIVYKYILSYMICNDGFSPGRGQGFLSSWALFIWKPGRGHPVYATTSAPTIQTGLSDKNKRVVLECRQVGEASVVPVEHLAEPELLHVRPRTNFRTRWRFNCMEMPRDVLR